MSGMCGHVCAIAIVAVAFVAMEVHPTSALAQTALYNNDISGHWESPLHEDEPERGTGLSLGEFQGLPINEEARVRAMTWDASIQGLREWRCRPLNPTTRCSRPRMQLPQILPGAGGGRGGRAPVGTTSKTVTTRLRAGSLRKNGVPYSADAVVTEHYNVLPEPGGDTWLIVTNTVDDPQFLTQPFVANSHFKKLADGSAWKPVACTAR